jgi:phosphotriesterase-related protein
MHEKGKVITVCGPVEPEKLGAVMMHEHIHSDWSQKCEVPFDTAKWHMLETYAVPNLKELKTYGCNTLVDMTTAPRRAPAWVYQKIAEITGINIVLATGLYREIELGKYWARTPDDQIWPYVRHASVEELEEYCLREVEEGILGCRYLPEPGKNIWFEPQEKDSVVHAGVLKIGTSSGDLTAVEKKAAIAVARAQQRTGLLINTHANDMTSFKGQLQILEAEGVNPERVCLGHTMSPLVKAWPEVRECMKRGATFLPTNLRMDGSEAGRRAWADAIRRAFDEGFGDKLTLGLDWAFNVGYIEFEANPTWRPGQGDSNTLTPCTFLPPPPFVYLYTHTIPRFKEMGITDQMLQAMLVENPKRILPVQ